MFRIFSGRKNIVCERISFTTLLDVDVVEKKEIEEDVDVDDLVDDEVEEVEVVDDDGEDNEDDVEDDLDLAKVM